MDLLRFGDQHWFFNESLGLFGLRPFFSMRVFGFLASGFFFQSESWSFWLQAFCKHGCAIFSYGFIVFL